MPLLTPDDLQAALNIDLTDPNGQDLAENLITAATGWFSSAIGFPIEQTPVTTYFTGEQQRLLLPTGAPVSELIVSSYNASTNSYDTIESQYVRTTGDASVLVTQPLSCGYQAVKATYVTGWTVGTLPGDLRQALIELVGIKLLEVANFSSSTTTTGTDGTETTTTPLGTLKRVQSDSYSEEYSTAQADAYWKGKAAQLSRAIGDGVPAGITETISRYQRLIAL